MASKAQPKKVVKQKSEKPPELYRSTSHELSSVHLGRPVHVEIIDPKTVSGPLPLLVLNDGQDSAAVGVKKSVERETATGCIPKILVVGVAAGDRMAEYGTAFRADYEGRGAKAGLYAKFVVLELMPWLAERYSISENPAERAVAGYSLGGLSAMDLAWNQHHLFGKTGVFSGSLWWRRYTLCERMLGPARAIVRTTILHTAKFARAGTIPKHGKRPCRYSCAGPSAMDTSPPCRTWTTQRSEQGLGILLIFRKAKKNRHCEAPV
ncbi:MAG: hypothetical protein LC670_04455 [Flavobacteriales bacterium]|nr:hypothetical protein [Flavobacteriales bacterium]